MNHLLSIEELDRAAIERIVEQATRFSEVSDREIKKVPALRGRMVLNLFYEASTRTRSSFELAAKRLSADVVNFAAKRIERREGGVAEGHGAHPERAQARRDRAAHALGRRRRAGIEMVQRGDRQRGRRQARAPDAGVARRLHAAPAPGRDRRRVNLDRRRRRPLAGRALEHHRLSADGREGDARRSAHADSAGHRGARVRGALHAGGASLAPTSSTRCGCSASECTRRGSPRCASTRAGTRSTDGV